jgi:hypothetical protein
MAISPKMIEEPIIEKPIVEDAFSERNPSNWNIVQLEDGSIEASCSNSFETFTGTVEDFNLRLRG